MHFIEKCHMKIVYFCESKLFLFTRKEYE